MEKIINGKPTNVRLFIGYLVPEDEEQAVMPEIAENLIDRALDEARDEGSETVFAPRKAAERAVYLSTWESQHPDKTVTDLKAALKKAKIPLYEGPRGGLFFRYDGQPEIRPYMSTKREAARVVA